MAEDLNTIFADSAAKAEAASNIAYQWANGDETTIISTDSGELPSLAKFMFDNVGAGSFSEFEVDLFAGNATISTQDWLDNNFFKATGHSVERTVTLPPNPKLAYFSNTGSAIVTLILGTTKIVVPPAVTFIVYSDGTANGLLNITSHTKIDRVDTVPPAVSNDISEGYVFGSTWYDASESILYFLVDDTEGAAVWINITGEDAAADILAKLLTVDGAGSGLDADLLDGLNSSDYYKKTETASQAEAEAATDNTKVMTALRVAQLLAAASVDADTLDGNDSTFFQPASTAVTKDSDTGSADLPAGTTAQRSAVVEGGHLRFNTETNQYEGSFNDGSYAGLGGASGGAGNPFVYENDITVTADYTITSGKNAMSAGPITIADGATVSVPDGSVWTIV